MIWRYNDRFGYPAWCDLEIHERPDGKRVFIATEIVHNPGRCITNDPVKLANEVGQHYALKAKDMIWIEHYPERQHCGATDEWLAECYEVVRLSTNRRGEFTAAETRRVTPQQVDAVISGKLQIPELFPTKQSNEARSFKRGPGLERAIRSRQLPQPTARVDAVAKLSPASFGTSVPRLNPVSPRHNFPVPPATRDRRGL